MASLWAAGRSRRLRYIATIAVTIAFSYIALRNFEFGAAWSALRASDFWWLLPALAAFSLGNLARALRWRTLFLHGRRPPAGTTLNAMMVGYFYNNILPARAGEAARVLVLTQRSPSQPVEITGTVVLERLYDTVSLLLIFIVAEPWLPHVSWFKTAAIVTICITVSVALAAAVLAIYGDRPLRVLTRPLGRFSPFSGERLEHTLEQIVHGLSGLRDWRVAIEAFLWTTVAWLLSIACAYFVALAINLHVSPMSSVLVLVAIGLSMILPSAPAAVGVFEGATLIALQAYDVPHAKALSYALVLHLVNFVPFLLVGSVLVRYNASHSAGAANVAQRAGAANVAHRPIMCQARAETDRRSDQQ
jgi:uncharacterized protein (TIRG00374 family)